MKIEAKEINGDLFFRNFAVKKESDNFYSVCEYDRFSNVIFSAPITSGVTRDSAAKKAKLLQTGYNIARGI